MIVTDLNIHIESKLVKKLDKMIRRCTNPKTKKDAVTMVEGSEGEGKTNTSITIAYYFKFMTQRTINMFFRLKGLIDFARSTENQIIIWDEPSLDSLSTDWYKEINKDLIRLLMTCRKKRHILIFNFVKFFKFPEYVVVDRPLGMIHMYSRDEDTPGRFVYIRKKDLERLYITYNKKKVRDYKGCYSFGGWFRDILELHFDKMDITIEGKPHCTYGDYELLKDKAILSIGSERRNSNPDYLNLIALKHKISQLNFPINSINEVCRQLEINKTTFYNWKEYEDTPPVEESRG